MLNLKRTGKLDSEQPPPTGTRKSQRRRRRLLCFDLLEETVGWWSLEAVRRLTGGANSRTLLRACRHNSAYKHAQRPRLARRIVWIGGEDWNLPAEVPSQPSPPIITGFKRIAIDFSNSDERGLISFAERAAPLLDKRTLWIWNAARSEVLRRFSDQFLPVLRDGGFRPSSVSLNHLEAEELGVLLRQPLIRDCPAVEILSSAFAPVDLVEWLHRPSTEERIMVLSLTQSSIGSNQQLLDALKSVPFNSPNPKLSDLKAMVKDLASTQAPADIRAYTLIYDGNWTPFRLENPESVEALVFELLTRDHFRAEDLNSSSQARAMCDSNTWWVLRRGCLVGPQLPMNWSPFEYDQVISLKI